MLSQLFARSARARRSSSSSAGLRRRLPLAETLEDRRLLAVISNCTQQRTETCLTVEVNEQGAFGGSTRLNVNRNDIPANNAVNSSIYNYIDTDPQNPIPPSANMHETGIMLGVNIGSPGFTRQFMTAGFVNNGTTVNEGGNINGQFNNNTQPAQSNSNRTSTFYYPNNAQRPGQGGGGIQPQIRIDLVQTFVEHDRLGPSGTSLVQTYTLEILSPTISSLEIVRYMDADIFQGGSVWNDGGGHRSLVFSPTDDLVFMTDTATNNIFNDPTMIEIHENHRDFGGYPPGGESRWEIGLATCNQGPVVGPLDASRPLACVALPDSSKPRAIPSQTSGYLIARLLAGADLRNGIFLPPNGNPDSDANQVVDFNEGDDLAVAIANRYFNLQPGSRIVYEVTTKFGHPPIGTNPPPPNEAYVNGVLYADLNANGTRDDPTIEFGLNGWRVYADLNGNGAFDFNEPFTRTNPAGEYTLRLTPGAFTIAAEPQPNWQQTEPVVPPGTYNVTLAVLDEVFDFDFGFDPDPSSISGSIFEDENADRVRNPDEGPLAGWTVFLDLNGDGVRQISEPSTTTDAQGRFTFTDLNPGVYTVAVATMAGFEQTLPASSVHTVNLGAGHDVTGLTYAFRLIRGSISGVKWRDLNGDGLRDPGEPGVGGVFIFMDLNNDGILSLGEPARQTAADGTYRFDNVRPNTNHVIRELLPAGSIQSFPADGAPHVVSVLPGQHLTGIDFGNRFLVADWGDAPAPYPTLASQNGAAHELGSGIFLGALVDAEPNGQPHPNAQGDTPDEDGVIFLSSIQAGTTASVRVVASADAILSAWIDFNRDGDWNDPGEQIFIDRPVTAGDNLLTFAVPANAVGGTSFARFRISSQTGLQPTGLAPDGEVEDYMVTLIGGSGGGGAGSWQNPNNALDVNNDGLVTIADALEIIGALRNGGARPLPTPPTPPNLPPPFLDVNGDTILSINDALRVIQQVLRDRAGGEGESVLLASGDIAGPDAPIEHHASGLDPADDDVTAGDDRADRLHAAHSATRLSWLLASHARRTAAEGEPLDDALDLLAADVAGARG